MVIIFLIPVLYYAIFLVYHTLKFKKYQPQFFENQFFVSIIIPIRNESENIEKCLESIFSQNYPTNLMEIVIVNDHSEDTTLEKLSKFSLNRNLKILDLPENKSGKKESLAYGIEHSKGEIILTTDGDTLRGKEWVQTMMNYFDENTAMVSGPVKLTGNSVWQQMQALEFSGLILLGAAMIANKRPSLCNGANLAYRKSVFKEVNGFQNIDQIASGDDELLLHKIRNLKKYTIHFAKNQKAIVETPAHSNLKKFIHQRLRWTSKSTIYPDKWITFHLLMAYLANLSILGALFVAIYKGNFWILGSLFCIKIISEYFILNCSTKFLGQRHVIRWLVIEQFLHILYVLWVGLAAQFQKTYEWKGRKVK